MAQNDVLVLSSILDILVSVATLLGVPWAIYLFWQTMKDQREARETAVYDSISVQWREFLKLALMSPKVGATLDDPSISIKKLSKNDQVVQDLLFEFTTSMFESVYIAYNSTTEKQRVRQWQGWKEYILSFSLRQNYREWWATFSDSEEELSSQYDADFEKFMRDALKGVGPLGKPYLGRSLRNDHAPR